jgi:hypothetical protein
VRILIWQGSALELEIDEGHWRIGKDENVGASYSWARSEWEDAKSGEVVVSTVIPDTLVAGSVNITFPSLGRFQTEFEATWVPMGGTCH